VDTSKRKASTRWEIALFQDWWKDVGKKDQMRLKKMLALAIIAQDPALSDGEVARLAGLNRRTLLRYSPYCDLKQSLREPRRLPAGYKRNGLIEAATFAEDRDANTEEP
jgi:hypothetical protein